MTPPRIPGDAPYEPRPADGGTGAPSEPEPTPAGAEAPDGARPAGVGTDTPSEPEPADSGSDAPSKPSPTRAAAHPEARLLRLADTVTRLERQLAAAAAEAKDGAVLATAAGILVERLHCAPADAHQQLSDLATRAGLTPLELASEIIGSAAHDRIADLAVDPSPTHPGADADARTPQGDRPSAALRLRRAETGALAGEAAAAARSFLDHALAPLGATAALLWAVTEDGSLSLRGHAGLAAHEAARWHHVPPGVATVARHALDQPAGVWLASIADQGLASPGSSEHPGARVALPAAIGGRIHGVLEVCWPGPLADQAPWARGQFEALAELCAHTLRDPAADDQDAGGNTQLTRFADGLRDPAMVLQPHRGPDGAFLDFRIDHANPHFADPAGRDRRHIVGRLLLEAYPLAAEAGGLFSRAERVHATGAPFAHPRMPFTVMVGDRPAAAVADVGISRWGDALLVTWRLTDAAERLADLLRHAERLGRIGVFEEDAVTGQTTWNTQMFQLHGLPATAPPVPLEQLADRAHPDDAVALGRFQRTVVHHRRAASTTLRLRGPDDSAARQLRVVAEPLLGPDGRLLAVRGVHQDISAQHWTEVALAATRDQLLHTERQAAEQHRLTWQLQHAIMPPETAPLDTPGLDIAVRYRPAESDAAVGGDWYDAVALPTKQILVCVGDVAGHGIDAATSMVVLRNALRGLAVTGAGPAQLLGWLNAVTHSLPGQVTATVVCGVYDPATRRLRWARAGHLPPLLLRGEDATILPMTDGILLGALADASYAEEDLQLEPDDILLMYTDGLIERRDRPLNEAQAQLLAGARRPAPSLGLRLDRLLTHSKADTDDDTCIVGIRVT